MKPSTIRATRACKRYRQGAARRPATHPAHHHAARWGVNPARGAEGDDDGRVEAPARPQTLCHPRWETDRGRSTSLRPRGAPEPERLISIEWGRPSMIETRRPELLLWASTATPSLMGPRRGPACNASIWRPTPERWRSARPRTRRDLVLVGGDRPRTCPVDLARFHAARNGRLRSPDPGRPAAPDLLPPALKPSPPRRSSPTSTCRSTTSSSTSPAGAPAR